MKIPEEEKEWLFNFMVEFHKKSIKTYLDELGMTEEDIKFYQELQVHLREGMAKHPDEPEVENSVADYDIKDWFRDLEEEFNEVKYERVLPVIKKELFHLMVVAKRMIEFIDQKIIAWEYDP